MIKDHAPVPKGGKERTAIYSTALEGVQGTDLANWGASASVTLGLVAQTASWQCVQMTAQNGRTASMKALVATVR
jgi:hypothetical protein